MKLFSSPIKIMFAFAIMAISMLSCQNTNGQALGTGSFTVTGYSTNPSVFTGTGTYADTAYMRAEINGTGPVTLSATLTSTGASIDSLTGDMKLYVSLDGTAYMPYPDAADSVTTLTNLVPLSVASGSTPWIISTRTKSWTRFWQIPNAITPAGIAGNVSSGAVAVNAYNPYRYYMIVVRTSSLGSTGATAKTWTLSGKWWCRRLSGYQ